MRDLAGRYMYIYIYIINYLRTRYLLPFIFSICSLTQRSHEVYDRRIRPMLTMVFSRLIVNLKNLINHYRVPCENRSENEANRLVNTHILTSILNSLHPFRLFKRIDLDRRITKPKASRDR